MKKGKTNQPINSVKWVKRSLLKANDYNPNKVSPIELELLKTSIKLCGWTQPIVCRSNYEIVDGFHRWTVSGEKEISEITDGLVPVVMMSDEINQAQQVAATIVHNRARGNHMIIPMTDIVRNLKEEHKWSDKQLQEFLGMEQEEIDRLYDYRPMTEKGSDSEFSKGWVPDDGKRAFDE
jgi:ParB-like chromosome segregation protein Spo0J